MTSEFNRRWILDNGIPVVERYGGNLTLRALHYQLVALGMTNDIQHYKKVVGAMIKARWDRRLPFDAFVDHERDTLGMTASEPTDPLSEAEIAKEQIKNWATSYRKNRWENQPNYAEVFIEKKALISVFDEPCRRAGVALNPCKGYPSITYLNDATARFVEAVQYRGQNPVIIYFGDYDCSGEDIPRSIGESLRKMGIDVEMKRIALLEDQVLEWGLPPAPTKATDSRSHAWDGIGQVELDAVNPERIVGMVEDAIADVFDEDLHDELLDREREERETFRDILRRDFASLLD